MATTVAATRQSFALLNGPRLQHLLNTKNRHNAIFTFSPTKRKAPSFKNPDSENIDPIQFPPSKKSKYSNGLSIESLQKPVTILLTKATPYPNRFSVAPVTSLRPSLPPSSPRLNTTIWKSTPLTGRSPLRKRIEILNRGKTASLITRVGPRQFRAYSGPGFSIDAALSGTISSYDKCHASSQQELPVSLHQLESKDSWLFDIHEDTPDELAENLMNHSVCTLDISSDEESAAKMKDKRGKENVPPLDDISQTRTITVANSLTVDFKPHTHTCVRYWRDIEGGADGIDRTPLGEMTMEGFPR